MTVPGRRATDVYELVGPIRLPVSRWSKFWAVLGAGRGHVPYELRSPMVYEVRDRQSGEVVYSATTQSDLSLEAWHDSLTSDLAELTPEEFDKKHGLTETGRTTAWEDADPVEPINWRSPTTVGLWLIDIIGRVFERKR